jgi:hypothetical protein
MIAAANRSSTPPIAKTIFLSAFRSYTRLIHNAGLSTGEGFCLVLLQST